MKISGTELIESMTCYRCAGPLILALCLVLSGCAAKKVVTVPYHWAYCDKMNADGVHCDRWATPCGTLHCKE